MPPRRTRTYKDTPATRELDARIARRDEIERQLAEAEAAVWEQVVVAAREPDSNITISELGRRVGYSREHVSGIVSEANKRDGWVKPARPAHG
ncbi:hypothetical protein GCM10010172_35260 [Paractinoplanes ferrugineus]|uniref:Uncharacterized protein n=2 Tax=Paractinoplanes ferrugineus TaxID=113564 RepID=A0A919JCF4_9ACTN|nr:hypothetical protein Afe05nite_86040 [Actinoplanes ferrugineus]